MRYISPLLAVTKENPQRDVLHIIARSDGLIRVGNTVDADDYGLIAPLLSWSSDPDNSNRS